MRRARDCAELVINNRKHFFLELFFRFQCHHLIGMLGYDESKCDLTLDLILDTNHGYLGYIVMA